MSSILGTNNAELWIVLLSVAVAIAVLAGISGLFFAWKRRSIIEEPLPHCNLEERLAQIGLVPPLPPEKVA